MNKPNNSFEHTEINEFEEEESNEFRDLYEDDYPQEYEIYDVIYGDWDHDLHWEWA